MPEMKLGAILRYSLGGGVYLTTLLALAIKAGVDLSTLRPTVESLGGATLLLAASFFVGTTIYVIHRAFPYLVVERVLLLLVGDRPTKGQRARLSERLWRRRASGGFAADPLDEWAAQIHFMYCAAWAIAGALLSARLLSWNVGGCTRTSLWRLVAAVLLLAVFTNGRFFCVEKTCPIKKEEG